MENITVGYAFCGSFCTISESLKALKELAKLNIKIKPIMSQIVYSTDTRFGKAEELFQLGAGLSSSLLHGGHILVIDGFDGGKVGLFPDTAA